MKQKNEDVSLLKKAFSSILACIGGFLFCAAAMAAFARMFTGGDIEFVSTLILVGLASGLLKGSAALWSGWRMALGIFLTAIGVIFATYLLMPISNQTAGFVAMKNTSVLIGLSALVAGICLIIYQHRRDNEKQTVAVAGNSEAA